MDKKELSDKLRANGIQVTADLKINKKDLEKAKQIISGTATPKPKKGDKVDGGWEGRLLKDGSKAPRYGKIISVSKGYAYVDFGISTMFTPVLLTELKPISPGIWKD